MYKRRGQTGLVDQLDALDHRINEVSRRSGRAPTCVVRLGANVGVPALADVRPTTQWKATPETDESGMFHYNEGGDTWWQLPNGGRYRIMVASHWAAYGVFDPSRPPMVATSLLLNSTGSHSPGTYGIAEATAFNPGQNTGYPLISEDRVFTTGDELRVNFWSQFGGTVETQQLQTFTHVVIRYLGAG